MSNGTTIVICLVAVAARFASPERANAGPVFNKDFSATNPTMSNDDLLQTHVTSKTEWKTVTKQYDGDTNDSDATIDLTDQNTYPINPAGGGIYTYHLDVTTNTFGYDITRVDMASGNFSDRAHQGYVFYVSPSFFLFVVSR